MIVPDDKNWTWVLDRACPECGFEASAVRSADVGELVRHNTMRWRDLLAAGVIRAGRPDDATWSPLEYACHVRDIYVRYDARVVLMLTEDDPYYPNWDQDASALDDRYDEQDPATAVAELTAAGLALATRLDGLSPEQWQRPGRRSDGASFTIDTLTRYMAHDTFHHVWDLTKS